MHRAALIGVSGFGAAHYRDLMRAHAQGRLRPAAAAIINPEEEAEKRAALEAAGCRVYDDHERMLAEEAGALELCCIPTGIALHEPMTRAALEAGAHVLVEKPAAGTIQEVRAMAEAARRAGRFVCVGFQHLHAPAMRALKRRLVEGAIGRIECVKGYGLWPRSARYYARNAWAGSLASGGRWVLDSPINNALAHYLMALCFLAGPEDERAAEPTRVRAALHRSHAIESADTASVEAELTTGARLLFHASHACDAAEGPFLALRGDAGTVAWSTAGARLERADGRVEAFPMPAGRGVRDALFARLLDRLDGRAGFLCGPEVAAAHTLCVNGAHRSSAIHPWPSVRERTDENDVPWVLAEGVASAIRTAHEAEQLASPSGTAVGEWVEAASIEPFAGPAGADAAVA